MPMMKLVNEEQLLDIEFRQAVIKEITDGAEEKARRAEAQRRHEVYRDMNKKWVIEGLAKEDYDDATLHQMKNRATNISIAKKIINKKAQAYTGGVDRKVFTEAGAEDEASTDTVQALAEELDFNQKMKKSDRYRELHKNMMIQVVPVPSNKESEVGAKQEEMKHDIKVRALYPEEYTVIEDNFDATVARAVIISTFAEKDQHGHYYTGEEVWGVRHPHHGAHGYEGNRKDDIIADNPLDVDTEDGKRRFVWWSDKYHFTTDIKGRTVGSPEGELNPLEELPFVNITADQDGKFWAIGGDVVDGSISINKKATDLAFISFIQGWGQMVITGKDLPKKIVGGPNRLIKLTYREGEPTPTVFYASSNPPIGDWLEEIRAELAMLLSSNGLASNTISTKLDVTNVASGISKILDQAEMLSDLKDVQEQYGDWEPMIWRITLKWHKMFSDKKALIQTLQVIPTTENWNVKPKFNELKPAISAKEKLEELKMRKELGLNTMQELLKLDNPELSDDEAEKRATKIAEEKKARAATFAPAFKKPGENPIPKEEEDNPAPNEEDEQ